VKSLEEQDPLQWPAVQQVVDCIHNDANGEKSYKGPTLSGYSDAVIEQCKREAVSDLKRLAAHIVSRLEWSNMRWLRAILVCFWTLGAGRSEKRVN